MFRWPLAQLLAPVSFCLRKILPKPLVVKMRRLWKRLRCRRVDADGLWDKLIEMDWIEKEGSAKTVIKLRDALRIAMQCSEGLSEDDDKTSIEENREYDYEFGKAPPWLLCFTAWL